MNLTKNIKIAIIVLAAIVVFYINLETVFLPQRDTFKEKGATLSEKKSFLGNLEVLKSKEKQIEAEKEQLRYMFSEFDQKLPRYLVPEFYVNLLKSIADKSNENISEADQKIKLQDISFTEPVEYKMPNINFPQKFSVEADQEISSYIIEKNKKITAETEKPKERIKPGELQYKNIADDKVVDVELDVKFIGGYPQVKRFISNIENSNNVMAIKTVSINQGEEKNTVTGNAKILIFGYKNDRLPIFSLWETDLKKGKNDVFSSDGSARYDIDNSAVGDFKITVNRTNDDGPTIIVGKTGTYGTEIYGDYEGTEEVELYIIERDGKFYYKYKTRSASYPEDYKNKEIEFTPSVQDNIIVKVFAQPRIENDTSGMSLTVYKQTEKNVDVKVYNDDPANPRIKINPFRR